MEVAIRSQTKWVDIRKTVKEQPDKVVVIPSLVNEAVSAHQAGRLEHAG